MNVEFPPQLHGTADQKAKQIYLYLNDLSQQLNYVLDGDKDTIKEAVTQYAKETGNKTENDINESSSALRQLIIKTADIVHKEMDELETTLNGKYEAVSNDFGIYKKNTNATLNANSERIEQNYNSLVEVNGFVTQTNAYIRTGYLYTDEEGERYGIAIGEKLTSGDYDTKQYAATLTGNRLSFWEQGAEVAYVTNRELHIKDAVFEGRLHIGKWIVDHEYGGFTIRWNGE